MKESLSIREVYRIISAVIQNAFYREFQMVFYTAYVGYIGGIVLDEAFYTVVETVCTRYSIWNVSGAFYKDSVLYVYPLSIVLKPGLDHSDPGRVSV